MSFLNAQELMDLGLGSYGSNVLISRDARIIGAKNVCLGNNVRIDPFTVILATKGFFHADNYIHISTHCLFVCGGGIHLEEHTQIASGCRLVSSSDDFSGEFLIGPCVPKDLTKVTSSRIAMRRLSVLGVGCSMLPGTVLAEGSAVGAHSLVTKSTDPFSIYLGTPAKKVAERSRKCLELAEELNGSAPKK